jgi:hypothetical protein
MKRLVALAASVACVAFLGACGSDAPGSAPTAPVAATPTPTPPPTPTPAPAPSATAAPFVSATARVLGFTRGGFTYSFVPAVFRQGDTINLDCTPRDADGRSTPNHPPFAEWYTSSSTTGGPILDRDYTLARADTYNPDLYIRQLCPAGNITVQCRVGSSSVYSNTLNLPTSGN